MKFIAAGEEFHAANEKKHQWRRGELADDRAEDDSMNCSSQS